MSRLFLMLLLAYPLAAVFGGNDSVPDYDQVHDNLKFAYWAFLLGGLSAISLPMGSVLGIVWKPSPRVTATLTAFGGGALLAALSIELVAPTVEMVVQQQHSASAGAHEGDALTNMLSLIIGCMAGGVFFYGLNEMLNSRGGYLRKVSTIITHFNHVRLDRYKILLKKLSRIELFRHVPKTQIHELIQYLKVVRFHHGSVIFETGEIAGGMYAIESGEVELVKNGAVVKVVKAGDIIGEISMLRHLASDVTAVARTDVRAFELLNDDFEKIRKHVPDMERLAARHAEHALDEVSHFVESDNGHSSREWHRQAVRELHHSTKLPTQQEILHAAKENNSAPLAIWLGIFLDGIPESFVIGAGFLIILMANFGSGDPSLADVVPYTLIAGLFLSNFPEAMSSSLGMRGMGWKTGKILLLWTSLMLMTAVGAVFGFYFSTAIPESLMIGVEGMAAGAMLTMIAQTMIPEAVHIGGHRVVGLGTLAGYLAAVGFKVFE